jgi:hypothetical protein
MTSVELPSSLRIIYSGAFAASGLRNVTLNEGLYEIGDESFAYTNIEHVSIPSTVYNLGISAFAYANVKTVYFAGVAAPAISNKGHASAQGSFGVSDVLITFNCGWGPGFIRSQYEGYDALVCPF